MSNLKHTLFWMSLFLAVVVAVCAAIYRPLQTAFMANWVFNFLIVMVLLVGIVLTYRQVLVLFPEWRWVAQFRTGQSGLSVLQEPRLLKPLARQLGEDAKRDQFRLSTLSLRTVLDGIHSRMDEQREITRYFISLLVFLGLLGTFWGLLGTINAVGAVISNLDMGQEDFGAVFADLQGGLQEPLKGMGTAFSSSLLGLGGSLILGFLDIQAGHAQNRFYDNLEEWLTGVTDLVGGADGSQASPEAVQGELERLAAENQRLKDQLSDRE
ncbi:MAG: flagellar motor protein MotA [Marinobacter sp.]